MTEATLADDYQARLGRWIESGGREELVAAGELAHRAMREGLGVVEISELHQQALARALDGASRRDPARTVESATTFFVESLIPFDAERRALRESNTNLRRLHARREEDAKRIAHSIHAEPGQLLASAAIALERVGRDLPDQSQQRLAEITVLLDEIHRELRRLSHQLRPPMLDQLGLLPALRFLAEGVRERSGVGVRVHGDLRERPSPPLETAVFRFVEEALDNVVKHSGAKSATVRVWDEPGRLCCSVRDAGRGFDLSAATGGAAPWGLGLIGIRERVHELRGTLRIDARPGDGAGLEISIPTEE
jgi:signal transduction histidine kinase